MGPDSDVGLSPKLTRPTKNPTPVRLTRTPGQVNDGRLAVKFDGEDYDFGRKRGGRQADNWSRWDIHWLLTNHVVRGTRTFLDRVTGPVLDRLINGYWLVSCSLVLPIRFTSCGLKPCCVISWIEKYMPWNSKHVRMYMNVKYFGWNLMIRDDMINIMLIFRKKTICITFVSKLIIIVIHILLKITIWGSPV